MMDQDRQPEPPAPPGLHQLRNASDAWHVLRSDDFVPVDLAAYLGQLQEQSGRDLSRLRRWTDGLLNLQHGRAHRDGRRAIAPFFSAAGLATWQALIENRTQNCLERLSAQSTPDLVCGFADALVDSIMPALLGVHARPPGEFIELIRAIRLAVEPIQSLRGLLSMQENFARLLDDIAAADTVAQPQGPAPLLLWLRQAKGAALTQEQRLMMVANMAIGSQALAETSASIICHVLQAPNEIRDADPPAWVTRHLERWIRLYAASAQLNRSAQHSGQLTSCPYASGDLMSIDVAAVNRDSALAPTNGSDLPESPSRHISFGAGAHKCPGAELSRVILRIALPRLFTAYPNLRLRHQEVQWSKLRTSRFPLTLPVDLGVTHHPGAQAPSRTRSTSHS